MFSFTFSAMRDANLYHNLSVSGEPSAPDPFAIGFCGRLFFTAYLAHAPYAWARKACNPVPAILVRQLRLCASNGAVGHDAHHFSDVAICRISGIE
jgi:hypothetical protein